MGAKNGQPKVTRSEYLVMLFGTKKCESQHMLLHLKE
jgi:hypothetical protein